MISWRRLPECVSVTWWFGSRGTRAWLTSHCPSVLWHCWLDHISLTRKIVSEMTYIVSSGTLNPTIPIPVLILTLCHVTKLTLINIKTHYFTESSPAFPLQRQASYDHQSLPLETECHLLQSPHNWILQADVQQRNIQQCYLNYSILVTSNSNFKFQISRTHDV